MVSMRFSVIIPLYNKEAEVERTLRSVLAQTLAPLEIVVVDDGSTDGSAGVVERIMGEGQGVGEGSDGGGGCGEGAGGDGALRSRIRLIRQANAGETAARNRAMAEARGDFFALVDADDEWRPGFLAEIAAMIGEFPECGLYSTGFDIVNTDGETAARTPRVRGVVDDFFRASMSAYVSIPSASAVPRRVVEEVGGFPEGMRLGGDQYMWVKIARRFPVCFSPARLVRYHMAAANRSAAIYRAEVTEFSFEDFLGGGFAVAGSSAAGSDSGLEASGAVSGSEGSDRGSAAGSDSGFLAGADSGSSVGGAGLGAADSEVGLDSGLEGSGGGFWLGEYVARVALGKAIVVCAKGGTAEGRWAERVFAYATRSRRLWWRLWVLNRVPAAWRPALHALYSELAWRVARRGL
jgi:hypothetical protein